MRTRLLHLRDVLKSGYWFLPLLLSGAAVVLAEICLALDRAIPDGRLAGSRFLYVADLEALRTTLVTVGTVTLGTAGVVFSLTTVPLTVAAAQFGSRLLRNFLRDTLTQIVLGAYFATFLYCVVVLFSLPNDPRTRDLPYISTTISLCLALASFILLVFFVNNIGVSLQAPVVIAEVSNDLTRAAAYFVGELCAPEPVPDEAAALEALWTQARTEGVPLPARATGYAQALDIERLAPFAAEQNVLIAVEVQTGQFVAKGDPVAYLLPRGDVAPDLQSTADIVLNKALYLGVGRVPAQDVEFAVNQLVEIAVRALSPAINDPFTAMGCLDRLSVGLGQIAGCIPAHPHRTDASGQVRVLYRLTEFAPLCDDAFHLIRQYGRGNADVLLRMLDAIERVATRAYNPNDRAALLKHARLITAEADTGGLPNPHDAARVRERGTSLQNRLTEK